MRNAGVYTILRIEIVSTRLNVVWCAAHEPHAFVFSLACTMAASPLEGGHCDVWIGNVPFGLTEQGVLSELRNWDIFPLKMVYRPRIDNDSCRKA